MYVKKKFVWKEKILYKKKFMYEKKRFCMIKKIN